MINTQRSIAEGESFICGTLFIVNYSAKVLAYRNWEYYHKTDFFNSLFFFKCYHCLLLLLIISSSS